MTTNMSAGQTVKTVDTDEIVTIEQIGKRGYVLVTGRRVFHESELTEV